MAELRDGDKKNFETLTAAFKADSVCLVDVQRVSDGKSVAAICAVTVDDEEMYNITPFAVLVEGNPFELFNAPDPDGEGYAIDRDRDA